MKKSISLILALLCLCLCACGGTEKQEPRPTAEPAAAPVTEAAPPVEVEIVEAPVVTAAPAPEKSLFDTAKALEGENAEELLAAVGEPVSREDYAPSCLGDGEDGLWHYADFDVYTYREGDAESVYAVMGK